MNPRAEEHKKAGDRAMQSLGYPEALKEYRLAYDVDPSPALLYNMGRALQAMGKFPEALEKLESFRDRAPDELKARVPKLDALIAELRAQVTEVTITSEVRGARVVIRNEVVGTTPFAAPLRLVAGSAPLEARADGYVPLRTTVELPGGGTLDVPLKFVPLSDQGLLVVRSPVRGAHVTVDGRLAGTVPTETVVRSGRHEIVVTRDGYEEARSIAVLKAGDRKELTIGLAETPSVVERWWFWAGAGVVVAGGAVLTVALLTERSPDEGSIPPGQLPTALQF